MPVRKPKKRAKKRPGTTQTYGPPGQMHSVPYLMDSIPSKKKPARKKPGKNSPYGPPGQMGMSPGLPKKPTGGPSKKKKRKPAAR